MNQQSRFQHPFFTWRKFELFVGAFLFTFMVIVSLGVIFPEVRDSLHQSATLVGFSSSEDFVPVGFSDAPFGDVPVSDPYAKSISYLKKRGVIIGFEDDTFKPLQKLSRAELMKLIVRSKNVYPYSLDYSHCFKDVNSEWFAPSVCYAQSKEWIQGYEDHTFRPSQNITSSEARIMVFKSFGISDSEVAMMKNLSEDSPHDLSRAEAAGLLAQVLSFKSSL